jgi:hypothetical protein
VASRSESWLHPVHDCTYKLYIGPKKRHKILACTYNKFIRTKTEEKRHHFLQFLLLKNPFLTGVELTEVSQPTLTPLAWHRRIIGLDSAAARGDISIERLSHRARVTCYCRPSAPSSPRHPLKSGLLIASASSPGLLLPPSSRDFGPLGILAARGGGTGAAEPSSSLPEHEQWQGRGSLTSDRDQFEKISFCKVFHIHFSKILSCSISQFYM